MHLAPHSYYKSFLSHRLLEVEYDTRSYGPNLCNAILAEKLTADHYTWDSPHNQSDKPPLPVPIQKAIRNVASLTLRGKAEKWAALESKIQTHFSSRKHAVLFSLISSNDMSYVIDIYTHSIMHLPFQYYKKLAAREKKSRGKKKKSGEAETRGEAADEIEDANCRRSHAGINVADVDQQDLPSPHLPTSDGDPPAVDDFEHEDKQEGAEGCEEVDGDLRSGDETDVTPLTFESDYEDDDYVVQRSSSED